MTLSRRYLILHQLTWIKLPCEPSARATGQCRGQGTCLGYLVGDCCSEFCWILRCVGQSSKLERRHIHMDCRKILVYLRTKGTSLGKGFQWD